MKPGGLIMLFGLLIAAGPACAQEQPLTAAVADQAPEYPGGASRMMYYLQKETRLTEMTCDDSAYAGCRKVFIKFTVDTAGKVIDPHVAGISQDCPGFDDELLRVIKLMPPWKPGMKDGKKVKVYYSIPVNFTLR